MNTIPQNDFQAAFTSVMNTLTEINVSRCYHWHGTDGLKDWSVLEWAGAMCGEAGEAANVAKKIKRIQSGMNNLAEGVADTDLEAARSKLAKEAADTFLYLNLMCAREGVSLAAAIIEVFNAKSDEYGFPEHL